MHAGDCPVPRYMSMAKADDIAGPRAHRSPHLFEELVGAICVYVYGVEHLVPMKQRNGRAGAVPT